MGLTDLSIDTLIALKVQDVTPDYVRGLQEQGLHPDARNSLPCACREFRRSTSAIYARRPQPER